MKFVSNLTCWTKDTHFYNGCHTPYEMTSHVYL